MTTIATICARGGSLGLPGKNILPLLGKPLIAHTVELARQHELIDRVFVSTDCERIAEVAERCGATVPGLRPAELATSSAAKLPVIEHLIGRVEATGCQVTRIVDLDPTSPLRDAQDVSDCLTLLDSEIDCVITGYPAEKNPYFNMVELGPDGFAELSKSSGSTVVARQQAPAVFSMNASIYVWWRETIAKGVWGGRTRLHIMPRERSIDIDSQLDFDLVTLLMQRRATDGRPIQS